MKIEHLIRNADQFAHIFDLNDKLYVADGMCDLTAFCVPSLRPRDGIFQINYSLGLLVLPAIEDLVRAFTECVEGRRYVILPKTIEVESSLRSIVKNGRISDWILSDMTSVMRKYTLPKKKALALFETEEDRFVESLKRVYSEKFDERILKPLTGVLR